LASGGTDGGSHEVQDGEHGGSGKAESGQSFLGIGASQGEWKQQYQNLLKVLTQTQVAIFNIFKFLEEELPIFAYEKTV